MKSIKSLFLFALIPGMFLNGCGQENCSININVGTKLEEGIVLPNYQSLASLLTSKQNEDVLLATFSTAFSTGCSCWSNFKFDVIKMYMKTTHVPVYIFDTDMLAGHDEKFGIKELTTSDPDFYVFKQGKKVRRYTYSDKGNNIIKSYTNFKKEMDSIVVKPENFGVYLVNDAYLDANLSKTSKAVLYIGRNGCGDCCYVLPNVLVPYFKENQGEIWLLDIQEYRNTTEYDPIKAKYNLTSKANTTFGYGEGVVPTFQYYQSGVLKDAAVYFNDSIDKVDNVWKVTDSYYTTDRLPNLNFLRNSNVENKVLAGYEIPQDELSSMEYQGQTYNSWSQEGAAKKHTPILKAFLDAYAK